MIRHESVGVGISLLQEAQLGPLLTQLQGSGMVRTDLRDHRMLRLLVPPRDLVLLGAEPASLTVRGKRPGADQALASRAICKVFSDWGMRRLCRPLGMLDPLPPYARRIWYDRLGFFAMILANASSSVSAITV